MEKNEKKNPLKEKAIILANQLFPNKTQENERNAYVEGVLKGHELTKEYTRIQYFNNIDEAKLNH
jgi:hypothetical protein